MADINKNDLSNPEAQKSQGDSIDLPDDLQVPIDNSSKESLVKSEDVDSIEPILPSPDSLQKGRSWLWVAIGIFVVILVGATAYLFLRFVSFNKGTIHFTFEPTGVDVMIDEKFNKHSVDLLVIKLKAGDHIIRVAKEGYLDFERGFGIEPKENSDMHVVLELIPNIELLAESPIAFAGLARNGKEVVYMNPQGGFMAVESTISQKNAAALFEDTFTNIQKVIWSPGEPMAMVKIKGVPQLEDMYDNREVRGRFVILGERPTQGLPLNRGISTWLFDNTRRIAEGQLWQPVLLNESIRDIAFAPDGGRIIYFYETADGEKSLIAAHPDGGEWERLATQINAIDPQLNWLNDDRYILLFDDEGIADRLFDVINKDFDEIMPDRIRNTSVNGSPDGTRILYFIDDGGLQKLAVWNIANGSREHIFDEPVVAFVWQTDERIIVAKDDNALWYWDLNGRQRPVQFVSSVGDLSPQELLYSRLFKELFIIESARILSLNV